MTTDYLIIFFFIGLLLSHIFLLCNLIFSLACILGFCSVGVDIF